MAEVEAPPAGGAAKPDGQDCQDPPSNGALSLSGKIRRRFSMDERGSFWHAGSGLDGRSSGGGYWLVAKPTALEEDLSLDNSSVGTGGQPSLPLALKLRIASSEVAHQLKELGRQVLETPSVLIIPILMVAIIIPLGSWAIWQAGDAERQNRRDDAQALARGLAGSLTLRFVTTAFMPSHTLAALVRQQPRWDYWQQVFPTTAAGLLQQAPEGLDVGGASSSSAVTLQLAPAGRIWGIYPPTARSGALMGLNTLNTSSPDFRFAFTAIRSRNVTIQYKPGLVQGGTGAILRIPIFVPNVTAGSEETWGAPPTPTPCTWPECYDTASSTKWWGFATAVVDLDAVLGTHSSASVLRPLLDQSYVYELRGGSSTSHSYAGATNYTVIAKAGHEPIDDWDPVVQRVLLPDGQEWVLLVAPDEGTWYPGWRPGLWAMVAVLGLLLPALMFAFLVSRERLKKLLLGMIPERASRYLRRGRPYAETYQGATLLFLDIVGYTNMSSHMAPDELVNLLNELYTNADELCRKHVCYKMETIGDALFCVAGCPKCCPADEGARRAARLALDLMDFVAGFVSSCGRRIQVRIGIHTGTITAAVVGQHPHYSVFGDAVNVAARMESHGAPSRVHVGASTAALLESCAEFTLVPRGTIEVKGKGMMSTFWLEAGPGPRSGSSLKPERRSLQLLNPLFSTPSTTTANNTKGPKRQLSSGGGAAKVGHRNSFESFSGIASASALYANSVSQGGHGKGIALPPKQRSALNLNTLQAAYRSAPGPTPGVSSANIPSQLRMAAGLYRPSPRTSLEGQSPKAAETGRPSPRSQGLSCPQVSLFKRELSKPGTLASAPGLEPPSLGNGEGLLVHADSTASFSTTLAPSPLAHSSTFDIV